MTEYIDKAVVLNAIKHLRTKYTIKNQFIRDAVRYIEKKVNSASVYKVVTKE